MDMLSNAYKLSEEFRFKEVTKHENFYFLIMGVKTFNEFVLSLQIIKLFLN